MGNSWRQSAIFGAGAAAGAVLAVGLALNLDALGSAWDELTELAVSSPKQGPAQAIRQEAPCPGKPSIAPAGGEDGQFKLVERVANQRASDVAALVVIGKEAAASGRPRDAEVAFIIACRVATQLRSDVHVADAKYQLAWHYANTARPGSTAVRDDLASRARVLYSDASRVYEARLGKQHEKSRFAATGLAALQQPESSQPSSTAATVSPDTKVAAATPPDRAATPAASPAPAPRAERAAEPVAAQPPSSVAAPTPSRPVVAAPSAPTARSPAAPPAQPATPSRSAEARSNDTRVAGAGPAMRAPPVASPTRAPAPPQRDARSAAAPKLQPSFDCAKARSRTERLICGDRQLAQLDRELGRLHARARTAAADPADFKRRSDSEWSRRESTCADRACLLAWYAQRRAQLLDELETTGARGGSVAGG